MASATVAINEGMNRFKLVVHYCETGQWIDILGFMNAMLPVGQFVSD
jgi:hypothetical protein